MSYVLTGFKDKHRQLEYGVMATLCFGCITTVIKYKLMTRNQ